LIRMFFHSPDAPDNKKDVKIKKHIALFVGSCYNIFCSSGC